MTVFGSLFTAVSGLTAQSQSLGMISNNIANVSTIGFKRTDAAFSSLVTGSGTSSTLYSPGAVNSVQNKRISQQGILQQSNSATDIAVSGNGFFVVKASTTGLSEPLYSRAGSFSEDSAGVLRNTAGFFLQGWPLDDQGEIPAGAADVSSLVNVDVAFLGGLTQPTNTASIGLNLDAAEDDSAYPTLPGFVPDFTRAMTVYDSLGEAQDLTVNFKKHASPTATVLGGVDLTAIVGPLSNDPNIDPTDTFDITVGATTQTITLNGTLSDLIADLNAIESAPGVPVLYATTDENGFLSIAARNPAEDITLTDGAGTPLADGGLGLGASIGVTVAPAAPTLLTGLSGTPNTEGWWTVEFVADTGAVINSGSINFSADGQLNALPTAVDGSVDIGLTGIDWGNGSELQDIDFDISAFSQFSGEYNVVTSLQNGAELGLRTGVSIDDEGYVTAQFSNGKSTRIYKLALATFANVNGLQEISGNVFRESDTSGNYNLREPGKGSAGLVASGSLESSNVDLADEFSKMIITQRAYSANTKVISTADQMTEELLRLR